MAGSKIKPNCLICYKVLDSVAGGGKGEIEEDLQLQFFRNYCQLLEVQGIQWNFKTDGNIFCSGCYVDMASLADLNDKKKKIKDSIDKLLRATKCTILNSRANVHNKMAGKTLSRIDYVRDMAVKEFEPHVKVLKMEKKKLIPNGYQIHDSNANSVPKRKVDKILPTSSNLQPDKNIRKEKGSVSSTNPKSKNRNPKIRSSQRIQTSVVKSGKGVSKKLEPTKKEYETIDLLSSDDEEKDPDFLASSSDLDELVSVSEKSWREDSISSSINQDETKLRKSARTKRKSIKMIEADNDNSQVEISSNGSNPLNKKAKLEVENNKYKCGDCACSFNLKKLFVKHMKILNHRPNDELFAQDSNEENKNIESDPDPPEEFTNGKPVEQYPFECKICWTRLATLSKLRSHERDHFRKTTYKCTRGNCQLSFTDTGLLDDHIKKVHENENEKSLLAFMETSHVKDSELDLDLDYFEDNLFGTMQSPTPEESYRIVEEDPMFKLDIDEPIIRPEENEPMSFDTINYSDPTPIDYSDGHYSLFDQLINPEGIHYM